MIKIGFRHTSTLVVGAEHTASVLGSGDMPVLATPALLALMENAAMLAVDNALPDGATTVGGYIESSHLCPTAIGQEVRAMAELYQIEDRKLYFHISAYQGDTVIAKGEHIRFIVDKDRFLSKL